MCSVGEKLNLGCLLHIHMEMFHGYLLVLNGGSRERAGLLVHISEETDNENE